MRGSSTPMRVSRRSSDRWRCTAARSRPPAGRFQPTPRSSRTDWGLDKPMPKEESLADIERHARVLGVNHFIFRVQWPGMPQEDALMQIERLGRAVAQRTRPTH